MCAEDSSTPEMSSEPPPAVAKRIPKKGGFRRTARLRYLNDTVQALAREHCRALGEVSECQCVDLPALAGKHQGVKCNDDCLNRMLFVECTDAVCPLQDPSACQNRRFQRREWARTAVEDFGAKGRGVVAAEALADGAFVMEFVGEVIDDAECERRLWALRDTMVRGQGHVYLLEISRDVVIDCTHYGNDSRFLNHSCDPNCEIQKWRVGNTLRLGVFTTRAVPAGAELCFDYKFNNFSRDAWSCLCGAQGCVGRIGSRLSDRPPPRRKPLPRPVREASSSLVRLFQASVPNPPPATLSHRAVDRRSVHAERSATARTAVVRRGPHAAGASPDPSAQRPCASWLCRAWSAAHGRTAPDCAACARGETVTRWRAPVGLADAAEHRLSQVARWGRGGGRARQDVAAAVVASVRGGGTGISSTAIDMNDTTCRHCGGIGTLLCCDSCPAAFHISCAGLFAAPDGDTWHCPLCKKARRTLRNSRRWAAGGQQQVDPEEDGALQWAIRRSLPISKRARARE